jgi:hypothetical protein
MGRRTENLKELVLERDNLSKVYLKVVVSKVSLGMDGMKVDEL